MKPCIVRRLLLTGYYSLLGLGNVTSELAMCGKTPNKYIRHSVHFGLVSETDDQIAEVYFQTPSGGLAWFGYNLLGKRG